MESHIIFLLLVVLIILIGVLSYVGLMLFNMDLYMRHSPHRKHKNGHLHIL
ncbi:MAG: hypothetical protein ACM3S2_12200 [Ignavibacteriales bacterium]